jgi:ATP/maltotriose-dependent transcriptional regulator MalT
MWHLLSGTPDNVTEDGQVVEDGASLRLRSEKESLRGAIEMLRATQAPDEVRVLIRLAASYLLAGDAETASRYVNNAQQLLAAKEPRDAA